MSSTSLSPRSACSRAEPPWPLTNLALGVWLLHLTNPGLGHLQRVGSQTCGHGQLPQGPDFLDFPAPDRSALDDPDVGQLFKESQIRLHWRCRRQEETCHLMVSARNDDLEGAFRVI